MSLRKYFDGADAVFVLYNAKAQRIRTFDSNTEAVAYRKQRAKKGDFVVAYRRRKSKLVSR